MKSHIIVAAGALLLTGIAAAPALAETLPGKLPPASGDASGRTMPKTAPTPNTGGVAPDTATTGSTSNDMAVNSLLSAIADSRNSATALSAMKQVSKVKVVKLAEVAKGDDARTVANAVKDNKDERKGLQAAIQSNPALSAKLKSQHTDPSSVVAAKIEADGSVTIFAQ